MPRASSCTFLSALRGFSHIRSEAFTGLVVVAITVNAVENVVGIQLAARNKPDYAISVSALSLATLSSTFIIYDGESIWLEGVALIGLYSIIAASFWWG